MTALTKPGPAVSLDALPAAKPTGFAAMLVGLLVLIGWQLNLPILKSVLPELAPMQPNTAVAIILLGGSLWTATFSRKQRLWQALGRVLAFAAALLTGAELTEYLFGWQLHIDQLWFAHKHAEQLPPLAPGQMSPASATSLLMLAVASLLLSSTSVLVRRLVQLLVLASLVIATLALVGYAYGFEALYKISLYASMSVHTAGAIFLLCIGVLYTRADFGIMAPIRSANMGGLLARQMLPAVLGIPLLLGWVRLVQGQQLGEQGFEMGITIHTVTTIVVFAVLVWLTARSMNEIDAQREEARKAEHEMRLLSQIDPLTGVLNRRSLTDRMEVEWERALRYDRPLSALMLDIDHFKKINDTHGHATGDEILKTVAMILLEQCRPSDLVCRYGGDEFCVLIPDTTEAGAGALATRLRQEFIERLQGVAGQPCAITGSFGIADHDGGADSVAQLIDQADQALLAAKQAGRDCILRASELSPAILALQ
jgi:diguanylate cyclase (GGDEF)-like protein